MRRIALGAGVSVDDVKELLAYYENLQKMIREVKRRRIPLLRGLKREEAGGDGA
jgi:signal recognition particle GTPase